MQLWQLKKKEFSCVLCIVVMLRSFWVSTTLYWMRFSEQFIDSTVTWCWSLSTCSILLCSPTAVFLLSCAVSLDKTPWAPVSEGFESVCYQYEVLRLFVALTLFSVASNSNRQQCHSHSQHDCAVLNTLSLTLTLTLTKRTLTMTIYMYNLIH